MSIGMVLLTAVAVLVFFGVTQRVLDKMHLSDRAALLIIGLMFFGTLLPNIPLGPVEISLGGALIPAGVCVYLLIRAGTNKERVRAIAGAILTAAAVYLMNTYILPDEPETIVIDPMYLNGIAAGLLAYALGRSRRGAFICGVLGVLLADVIVFAVNLAQGVEQTLVLGGAGIFDAAVISGLIGVILTELIGEIRERLTRGSKRPAASPIHNPIRNRGDKA
jgi:uncharacterized membrane protein